MHVRDRFDLLPLRQMVTVNGEAAPAFARQGLPEWLSKQGRYQIVGHECGGQILAVNELAMAEAQLVLRQAYGSSISFGIAAVHSYMDPDTQAVMVPVMFLRIDAPRSHARGLQQMLMERCAEMKKVDLQRDRVVIRAELELARALGLERHVGELTEGAAYVLSWLLRYQRAARLPEPISAQRIVRPAGEVRVVA